MSQTKEILENVTWVCYACVQPSGYNEGSLAYDVKEAIRQVKKHKAREPKKEHRINIKATYNVVIV
jgi:hypothetical protein